MASPRAICVAQTCPVKGDVDENVRQHLRLAEIAALEGAQVVVFPELSLTGYEIDLASDLAFSEHDPRLAPLLDASSVHAVTLIAGAPVRVGAHLHIAAFVLGSDRQIALYTKHRLGAFGEIAGCEGLVPPAEATVFKPGGRNPLVRFNGHTAAVAVCADIGRPSHPRQAADRGAKTYLVSMFVIPSEFEGDAVRLSRYAAEHSFAVALANFGGPSGGLAAAGRSSIWSETGELVVRLGPSGAGVAIARETPDGWRAKAVMLEDAQPASSVF